VNALREFETAKELGHNDINVNIAFVQRRQGKMEQAEENFSNHLELDPRSAVANMNLMETQGLLRKYKDSEISVNRAIALNPNLWYTHHRKSLLYLKWKGDTKMAREVFNNAEQMIGTLNQQQIILVKYQIELYDGRYKEALDVIISYEGEVIENQFSYFNRSHLIADTYRIMDNNELAKKYYQLAKKEYDTKLRDSPEDSRLHSSLGLVYAGLGRKEEAIKSGKQGVILLPISREAWGGVFRLEDLATIYATLGEQDEAINLLENLLAIPGNVSVNLLKLEPKWNPLREHPRFIELIQK